MIGQKSSASHLVLGVGSKVKSQRVVSFWEDVVLGNTRTYQWQGAFRIEQWCEVKFL